MDKKEKLFSVKESELLIGNDTILFKYPIKDILEISGMLIVRLESPIGVTYNENVFGISFSEKRIKWRIGKRKYNLKDCPYTYIRMVENHLRLFNWCSFYLDVNPITGEVLEQGDSR